MLDTLVLSNLAVEYDALIRIGRSAPQRRPPDADRLGCNQNTFRIESVEDHTEAVAFRADPIVFRNALDVLPKHGLVLRPATVEVVVHPPIPTRGWRKRDLDRNVESVRKLFEETLAS